MPLHPLFAFFLSCVPRSSVLFCLGNSRELLKKRRRSSPCPSVALLFSFLTQRERKRLHNKEWTRALLSCLIQKMDRSEEEETPPVLSFHVFSSFLFSSLRVHQSVQRKLHSHPFLSVFFKGKAEGKAQTEDKRTNDQKKETLYRLKRLSFLFLIVFPSLSLFNSIQIFSFSF